MGRIVLTELGAAQLLKQALGLERPEPILLKLYINAHRPGLRDTENSYAEMEGHAYAAKRILPTDWRLVKLEQGGPTALEARPISWVFGDGDPISVYGSYAVGARRRILYWGDPLEGGPILLRERDERLEIQPVIANVIVPGGAA